VIGARTFLRGAALAACLALALPALRGGPAGAAEVKDPEYAARHTALRKALSALPEAVRVPMPPANENLLAPQQFQARAREQEEETVAAVKAARALAGTRDSRVFEELVRGLSTCGRMVPVAREALDKASEAFERVRDAFFQKREDDFRRTGSWPQFVIVGEKQKFATLDWQQREAAHAVDYVLRLRDAIVEGMGRSLEVLGPDGKEAWKAAVRMGLEGRDPLDRAAFCEAVQSFPAGDAEPTLLAIESKEKDPVVLCEALEALSLRRSAEGFKRILKRLDDPDPAVVAAAVRATARFRAPETIPALVARLAKAEGRVFGDVIEALFAITGKHNPDSAAGWEAWWKKDGQAFLRRWSDDVKVRLDEVETIGLTDERLIDVPAELAALLPTENDAGVRDAVLENLSIHHSDFARVTLLRALYDPNRSTRIAAIRGLAHYRHVSVPEELIRFVPRADADELKAVFQSLRTLWGGPSEFLVDSADREKIERWWETSKDRMAEQFQKLGAKDIASGRKQTESDESRWRDRNFYGLRIESNRVLFVMDVSLSMEEPARQSKTDPPPAPGQKVTRKIDVAKSEMTRVLRALPDGILFGLVFFSNSVQVWDQGMVVMGPETRKKAAAWVDALQLHEATNIYDALEAAFRIGMPGSPQKAVAPPDTIYFMTDGEPTAGKFLKPDIIREHVRRWNKGRNVKIHAVGVGSDHDVVFLRNLAEENGGIYIAH
jgi:hypothetical protein